MENTNENVSMSKKYRAYMKTPMFWIPRIFLMLLCIAHDFTKYKICRSFKDLFYWPDGFCADTVVIYLFLTMSLWCLLLDFSVVVKCKVAEMKALADEIDYNEY